MTEEAHPVDAIAAEFTRLRGVYEQQGMVKTVGFGERPAVICIDLISGFTDPEAPMGLGSFGSIVPAARRVLDAARRARVLVVLVGSTYDPDFREAGAWERKVTHSGLVHGSDWIEFDEGLGQTPGDQVVYKRYPSAFFGTDLASRLVAERIDTVIAIGAATSGCIRASVVDAVSLGFRVAVVEDAVGDRERLPHLANLFDMSTKYADVVAIDQVLVYLEGAGR